MSATETKLKRKPPARRTEVVLAALDERLRFAIDADSMHYNRVEELMDELRRSLLKKGEPDSE